MDGRLSRVPAPGLNSSRRREQRRLRDLKLRRKFLFESLEDRSLMATWTGLGAAGVWADDMNWGGTAGATPDTAGETAVFDGAVAGSSITIASAISIDSLTFSGAATGFAINSGVSNTFGAINHAATGSNAINSVIGGASSVAVNDGTFTLGSALNTYTGTTAINKGVLSAADLSVTGGASSLGNSASAITLGNATNVGTLLYTGATDTMSRGITLGAPAANATGNTLNLTNASADLTISGAITGGPGNAAANTVLTINGAGRTILTSGSNTFTGNIVVDASRLSINNEQRLGGTAVGENKTVTVQNNATLFITGNTNPGNNATANDKRLVVGAGGGNVDVSSGVTYQLDDASQISGSGTLTKLGLGTLFLGNAYANTGGINLNAGTLRLNASSTVTAGAIVSGPVGTGTLTINGGTLQANDGNVRTIHNTTVINADFTMGATGIAGITIDPQTVTLPAVGSITVNGARTINAPAGTQRLNGTIIGTGGASITKTGAGDLVFANNTAVASTMGNVTVSAGRLFLEGTSAAFQQNSSGAGTYTVNSGATLDYNANITFTPTNPIVLNSGANIVNRQGTLTLPAATTTLPTAGTLIVNQDNPAATINLDSPIALTGDLTIQTGGGGSNGGTPNFNGIISGGFNIIKTGVGMARLSAANTYTGTSQVTAGALVFTNPNALPGGIANFNPSKITVESGAALGLTVGNGATQFSNSLIDTVLLQMGPSTATTGMKPGSFLGLDTTANSFNLFTSIANLSGGNSIGLSKLGGNTLVLEGNNSYSGSTTINAGTVQVGNNGTTGNLGTGPVNFPFAGAIQFNRSNDIVVPNLISGGTIGSLTQAGAGNLTFSGANNHSFSTVNVNSLTTIDFGGGNTTIGATGGNGVASTTGGVINATGGTVTFFGSSNLADNASNTGTILVINAKITGTNAAQHGFEGCCATGTVMLTNPGNDFPGTSVLINNGTSISVSNIGNQLSTTSNLGKGTTIAWNTVNGSLIYTGTGETSNRILSFAGTNTIANQGTGALVFSSPLTASGTGAKTLILTGSTSGTGELQGVIPNNTVATNVTKSGTGTWILSGANTYTGATTVNGGLLLLNGAAAAASAITVNSTGTLGGSGSTAGAITVASGGTLNPGGAAGATGKLSSTAAVTFAAGSTYAFQLGADTTPGTTYDQLTSTGNITLTGASLTGSLLGTFVSGTSNYDIITTTGAGVISGTFAGLNHNDFVYIGGQKFQIQYTPTSVRLVDQNVSVSTSTVYVNNNWANTTLEADADGGGVLSAQYGVTAFADIQSAINALPVAGGTVVIQGNATAYSAPINVHRPGINFQFAVDTVPANAAETSVLISGPITLTNAPTFSNATGLLTNAAGVTFSGTINGGVDLDFSGMTTPITLTGIVGGIGALNSLTSASNTTIGAAITTTGNQTFNAPVTVSAAATLTAASLNAGAITLNNNLTTNVTAASAIAGNVTGGAFGIIKTGGGALTLSGTNTYTGTTAINGGTLKLGSSTALPNAPLTMAGTGILDLNGFNATVSNVASSLTTNTIIDNSAGAGTSTFTVTAQANTINSIIRDGATRTVAFAYANNLPSTLLFPLTAGNTFSGGLTLLHNAVGGTRLWVNGLVSTIGTAGAIVSSPFGRGPIIIGQAATDRAGIYIGGVPNLTIHNEIIFNTAAGNDFKGIRVDSLGNVLTGKITANLANAIISTGATGAIRMDGQVTGANGFVIDNAGTAIAVTLNNLSLVNPNNYLGTTTITGSKGTLNLAAANQIPEGAGFGNVINEGRLNLNGFNEAINGLTAVATTAIVDGMSGTPIFTVGNNNASTTYAGVIRNTAGTLALVKEGTGTLTVSNASTYSGSTTLNNGGLTLNTGANLANTSGITVGSTGNTANLNVASTGTVNLGTGNVTLGFGGGTGNYSQTGAGSTVNIAGGVIDAGTTTYIVTSGTNNVASGFATDTVNVAVAAGSVTAALNVNGGAVTIGAGTGDLDIGRSGTGIGIGTLNLANATSANINVTNLRLGTYSGAGTAGTVGTLLLPTSAASVNTITASAILLGDSSGTGNTAVTSTLNLGAGNTTINADTVAIGQQKSNAAMQFSGPGGTLLLRGTAGGSTLSSLAIGNNSAAGTGTVTTSTVNLAGGTFNAQLSSLIVGAHASGAGSGSGTLTMDAGTVAATSLGLGNGANSGTVGTLNLNGGAMTVAGTVSNTAGTANLNQNGGTLRFITLDKGTGAFTYTFNAGTIQNVVGSNATNVDVNVNVNGAGAHSFNSDAGRNLIFQSAALVTGTGNYAKDGFGALTLGGVNTNTGAVAVNAGKLVVDGSTDIASAITVNTNGTLGGTGTINGTVTTASTGVVDAGAQGALAGTLLLNNSLILVGGSTFAAQLGGATPGDGATFYDQVTAAGAVDLGSAGISLSLIGAFVPTLNVSSFTIINKTSPGQVTGTFQLAGDPLYEGEVFASGGTNYQITYQGGDGNDVVVRAVDLTTPALQGTPGSDIFLVRANGANTEVLLGGNLIYSGAPTSLSIDGLAGNDTFNVSFATGNPVPAGGLNVVGGTPTTGPGDVINVSGNVGGTPFTSLEYDVTGVGAGTLTFAGPAAVINFSGLEPAVITSLAGTVTIDIDNVALDGFAGPITTTITDAGGGMMLADFDVGAEDLTFVTPTVALNIIGDNDGNDTVIVSTVPAGFAAALSINGQGGTDVITNNATLTLGSGTSTGVVALTAETINLNGSINTTAVATGSISLTGTTVNLGNNLSTDSAAITFAATNVILTNSVTLDTEAGNNSTGGNVTFGTSALSANALGRDLAINTSSTGAALSGGAVQLGVAGNAGTQHVNDLTITTTAGAGGTAGTTTIGGNITLNENGNDGAAFTIAGNGDVAIGGAANGTISIITDSGANGNNSGAGNSANSIAWGSANVWAVNTGVTLVLNANSATAAGGAVGNMVLGVVDNNSGANNYLRVLTFTGSTAAVGASTATFNGNVSVDGGNVTFTNTVAQLATNVTIDTAQGATGTAGSVTFSNSFNSAAGGPFDLTVDTSAPTTGGNITIPGVNSSGLNDVLLVTTGGTTTGSTVFNGGNGTGNFQNFLLDNNGADLPSLTIVGILNVNSTATNGLLIDTEQGNNAAGGFVDLSGVVRMIAGAAGRDLTINTSTGLAAGAGGNVILPLTTNTGGQYLNDLSIVTTPGAGGVAGTVTLGGNIALDANVADGASLAITGGGSILLATDIVIDVEQGDTAGVGASTVSFGTSAVSSTGAIRDLTINTSNIGTGSVGGDVTLAVVNAAGGFGINDLTINASAPAGGTFGNVALNGAINLVTNVADVGDLSITGGSITQAAAAATTITGNVAFNAQQAVTLNNLLSTTGSGATGIVSILANQDGVGAESLLMNAGSSISTLNDTATAVTITVNTATGTGNATLRGISAGTTAGVAGGRITVNANAGAIIDGDNLAPLTAGNLVLQAGAGIGSGDAIETVVSNLEAVTGSGGVSIANTGNLTLGGLTAVVGVSAATGNVGVSTTGSLIVSENVTASSGNVTLSTIDDNDAPTLDDDLTINAGVTVQSTTANVFLNAGDDASINGNVSAALQVVIGVDVGDAELPAGTDATTGGTLTIANAAVITTPLAPAGGTYLNGNDDYDTFNLAPQGTTEFFINGNLPTGTSPGDTLNLDISAAVNPLLTLGGIGAGMWTFDAPLRQVAYVSIEDVNANAPYHLALDANNTPFGNTNVDDHLTLSRSGADFVLSRTGDAIAPDDNDVGIVFQGDFATILSFTYLGSNDRDFLTINDVGGLVNFSGLAPGAGDNTNLAGQAEFFFDGGGNDDTLIFALTGPSASQTYAFGTNSGSMPSYTGEVLSTSNAVDLQTYFANVELVQRTGAGATPGALTVLGSDVADALSIAANLADTRVSMGVGYTPFDFSGDNFTTLNVNALAGADSLNLLSLGSGQNNDPTINLHGQGLFADDGAVDTLRVQSTSGNTGVVALRGGLGGDLFQLFDAAPTVDFIAGPVIVDGSGGDMTFAVDRLEINDSGDLTGDTVALNALNGTDPDYVLTGLNASGVTFRNIDNLDYTGTSDADNINSQFTPTTTPHDLDAVILRGSGGNDQFRVFTSDQIGGTSPLPSGTPSGVTSVSLFGDAGLDTFGETPAGLVGTGAMNVGLVVSPTTQLIRPSTTTAITINGGIPTNPLPAPVGDIIGDTLNLDITSIPNTAPVVVAAGSSGVLNSAGQPVAWSEIEDLNLVDQGKLTNVQIGDLFARTTSANDLIQFSRNNTVAQPHRVRLRINSTFGDYNVSNKTIVYAGDGADYVTQANLTVSAEFYGEGGNDLLYGATNNDWLVGGLDNDSVNGGNGDNVLWGDNAPASTDVVPPQDSPVGGNDTLSGGTGNDVIYGGGGNDRLGGFDSNDYLHGGFGDDIADGGNGDDRVYGGAGNDQLAGYLGNDLLIGEAGNDILNGGSGNDVLIGGTGEDNMSGEFGNDLLITGSVANEHSTWTSVASVGPFSAATYSNATDNDAALLALLNIWGTSNLRTGLATITHDGVDDDVYGKLGDDDFCWEAADVADQGPTALSPPDFQVPGNGTDERFGPTM
ncbi:beta strand repeat-containing protein [Anatilimnocola sp. NA78]|uniref:beta strand repeat-containing protein n=1 Tax=Anatilimnocola sp. NA78 TaxID=3415683 RepID=UPI003CE49901